MKTFVLLSLLSLSRLNIKPGNAFIYYTRRILSSSTFWYVFNADLSYHHARNDLSNRFRIDMVYAFLDTLKMEETTLLLVWRPTV